MSVIEFYVVVIYLFTAMVITSVGNGSIASDRDKAVRDSANLVSD